MTDIAKSTPSTIEIVQRDNAYQGFYKLDRVQLRHEKFDGGMSRVINREVFVRHDAVCVLPYDPQRDEVVLNEQFRVGAMGRTDNPWLIELVAGLIDKDAELARLAKEVARLVGECGRIEGKLGNEAFVAKAPEAVITKEREKLEDYRLQLTKLEAQQAEIAAL